MGTSIIMMNLSSLYTVHAIQISNLQTVNSIAIYIINYITYSSLGPGYLKVYPFIKSLKYIYGIPRILQLICMYNKLL